MFCFVFLAPYARTTRYEEVFLPKGKNGLGRFAPSALPHYYKNTLFTYILAPIRTYVPAVLYTSVGCACRVKLRMTKGVVFYCFDHYE